MAQIDALIEVLAFHSATEGVIGQIRFYEDEIPDLLLSRSGKLVRVSLSRLPEDEALTISRLVGGVANGRLTVDLVSERSRPDSASGGHHVSNSPTQERSSRCLGRYSDSTLMGMPAS